MKHLQPSQGRSALIIEDEFLIALDLEATVFELGFDVCALAPSANKARSLAMNDQPDVAIVDVCLDGCMFRWRSRGHRNWLLAS